MWQVKLLWVLSASCAILSLLAAAAAVHLAKL
jgi:hypothetical protein